jgi:hypothetical protein
VRICNRNVTVLSFHAHWHVHTGSESGRYLGVMYLEALVWVVTLLVLMVDVGERFWPPFVCLAAWIVFVVFTLFYTQVGAND